MDGPEGASLDARSFAPLRAVRVPALATGLLLLAASAVAGTSLVTDITNSSANESHSFRNFDAPTHAVADFDGDGIPEIVAHNDNQYVYVLATTTPRVLAEFRPDYPSGWTVRPINDPAVADVDADGRLDIVVVNSAGKVCVYEYQSGTSTTSMSFARQWCRTMDYHDSPGADAGAAVADVNGDGKMEIFSQVEKKGLFGFRHDGSYLWTPKNEYGGNAGPLVTDIDDDGRKDVIFFSDGGTVRAYDAASGSSKWTFWAGSYVKPASITLAGNAADVDGDGKKEVVFGARDAPPDDTYFYDNHLMIFVLSHTGSLQKRWQPSWANPLTYTHPVLVDVDGNGVKDILMQDWNTIGHKPGSWEKLGPAHVFAFRHDGTELWMTTLDNSWSNDDLAVADVDGDGKQEVLAIGYNGGMDGMWYLDLRTGAKESHVGVGSGWQILRGPVAGNLLGDGKTSWAASADKSGSSEGAIKVYRTDAACSVAFGGWQNEFRCDGGSTPPPPPPPPSGDFAATFSSASGNEWWLEVDVDANEPLSGVHASINGGSWKTLELKSWGEWAASFHIEPGHLVKFRAEHGGAWTESCWYSHPTGTAQCDGTSTPPPTGTFSATFSDVRGNEWWVETEVAVSGGTLAGVDARVNGGSWVALEKKSWGSWAKSIHAPPGSTVEFRARATDGQVAMSSGYTWPPS